MRSSVRSICSMVLAVVLPALTSLTLVVGCGGGSGNGAFSSSSSSSSSSIASSASNVVAMTVDAGPASSPNFNIPYVSVTICAPGSTTNCQTIDDIQVDTGSYGLRVISSVLNSSLLSGLTTVSASTGSPLVECTQFADGYSWGSVRTADVQIASEKASGIPIQVIGDSAYPNVPTECQTATVNNPENTVDTFGANGILGVGPFVQDCGTGCVDSTSYHFYFSCTAGSSGSCSDVQVTLAEEVANPVAEFTTDNNGVILQLPTIADAGAASATGALVFGIGTESNNALSSSAKVLTTDGSGYITVTFNGTAYTKSYIDSGSNLLYFTDGSLTTCTLSNESFFCPATEQTLSATSQGQNGVTSTVSFLVANAQTQLNTTNTAFDNVAAPASAGNSSSFDFGVPFFYGRSIYTAIDGMAAGGTDGPYFAY